MRKLKINMQEGGLIRIKNPIKKTGVECNSTPTGGTDVEYRTTLLLRIGRTPLK